MLCLRNSLLAMVGFLEAANASDFAANVWNQWPAPMFAMVLMGIGGVVALSFVYWAARDGWLSFQNLRGLRAERRYLRVQRLLHHEDAAKVRTIDCLLDVNFRETGTEVVDRVLIDSFMGFGALVISIGTFLSIRASDPETYTASNLMTGYIGNAPCAICGLINLVWSVVVIRRNYRQRRSAVAEVAGTRLSPLVKIRSSGVVLHAALNGVTGIVAGIAALITSTQWWAYVVLAPCIVTAGLVNIFWRRRIGYQRPFAQGIVPLDEDALVSALHHVVASRQALLAFADSRSSIEATDAFTILVSDPRSLTCAVDFIVRNHLFEPFCLAVLNDPVMSRALFPYVMTGAVAAGEEKAVTVDCRTLITAGEASAITTARLLSIAKHVVNQEAPQCFVDQERYLLEVLASFVTLRQKFGTEPKPAGKPKATKTTRPTATNRRNANTYSGRHGNDWLFGGFSFRGTVRKLWAK